MKMNTWAVAALLGLATGAAGVAWLWAGQAEPDAAGPNVIATGAAVYAEHCAACHGERLEGEPNWRSRKPDGRLPAPPHDETGHTWHHPDAVLFDIVKHGPAAFVQGDYESDMPGFAGVLSDAEIRASLEFIKSTWPPEVQTRQRLISTRSTKAAP